MLAAALLGVLAWASAGTARAQTGAGTAVIAMSNERTVTYWANPLTNGPIHASPSRSAPVLARLHPYTEDGFPEVYIILARETTANGVTWAHVAFPGRPNGRTGWVAMSDLEVPQLDTEHLVIDLGAQRVTLYRSGRQIFSTQAGVGSPSDPTPTGTYWVREKFAVAEDPAYGPFAFGTSDYSDVETDWPGGGVVGIHGTDQPQLIPGDPSHGCIRLRNADITRLYGLMSVGTPISIVG